MTQLEELIKRAAPLPWRSKPDHSYQPPAAVFGPPHPIDGGDYAAILRGSSQADADLARHASNMLPRLVEALEDAREIILDIDPDAHARTRPLSAVIDEANNPEVK